MKRHCIYQKSCKYSTHGFFNLVSNPFVYKVSFIKKIIQYSKDMLPPFDCKMTFHVISALRWQLKKRQELCILKFNIMARFQQCTAACYVKLWYLCWTCGCSFLLWGKSVENCWFYGSLLKNNISHTQTEKFTGLQGANYNHFLRSNADVFCWHRFAYGFFFSYCFPFFLICSKLRYLENFPLIYFNCIKLTVRGNSVWAFCVWAEMLPICYVNVIQFISVRQSDNC